MSTKEILNIKGILNIKLQKRINFVKLEVSFGPKYREIFGDKFYNVWTTKEEYEPIYLINFTKDLEGFEDEIFPNVQVGKDVLLKHFYFNPSKYREDSEGGDKYWNLLTAKEKKFYKGKGFVLLCMILKEMITSKFVASSNYIILEASGGNSAKDMKELVKYYKKLSFKPWTTDVEKLEEGYGSYNVPMITKVSKLYKICKR